MKFIHLLVIFCKAKTFYFIHENPRDTYHVEPGQIVNNATLSAENPDRLNAFLNNMNAEYLEYQADNGNVTNK